MALFAQHGSSKSDKIEKGLRAGIVRGVALSPRYEGPTKLQLFSNQLRFEFGENATIIFDPQFYAAALPNARAGALTQYPYFEEGLTRAQFRHSQVHDYAQRTLDYQSVLPVDRLVTPTVYVEDVNSHWCQIAFSLAQEAQEICKKEGNQNRLLAALSIDESVLKHRVGIDELLEEVTTWDVHGFLLTVGCGDTRYPALLSDLQLANLMYLVYVLADRNEFEVLCTHADFVGLLLHAVGAHATSTGWFSSQRQFSLKAFEPPTGGGRARDRYTSASLLNSILVIPELSSIVANGYGAEIIAGTPYDSAIARDPGNAPWPLPQACLHHWTVLDRLIGDFTAQNTVKDKLDLIAHWVAEGIDLYRKMRAGGVVFEETTGPRNLEQWQRALHDFREEVR